MPDFQNSSFIPKAGPVGRRRTNASKQIYIFTLVSYVLIFATLIASGGVFLLKMSKQKELTEAHTKLYNDIADFDDAKFQEVISYDRRLKQAKNRIDNSVSVVSIFDALEASTIDTVQIDSLLLERERDKKITLTATIHTDSFDSTLFQRQIYGSNEVVSNPVIQSFDTAGIDASATKKDEEDEGDEQSEFDAKVKFETVLEIPLLKIPYTGLSQSESSLPEVEDPVETDQTSETITSDANQENL